MASLRVCGVVVVGLIAAACSGAPSTGGLSGIVGDAGQDASANGGDATVNEDGAPGSDAGQSNGGDASDGATSTSDAAGTGDGAARSDASDAAGRSDANDGATNDGATDDGAPSADASDAQGDVAPPPCPDVHGAYAITPVDAQGCGGSFNASAAQCVRQTACGVTFQSNGSNKAINGDAALQSDGAFSGASLTEGSLMRTGCTGTWNAATSTMTVDCGGMGSSQACVLSLARTGFMCP